jgi:uncharacterized membrane protein
MNMLGTFIKPMHPEGWRIVGAFAAVTLVLFWLWAPLGLGNSPWQTVFVVSLIYLGVVPFGLWRHRQMQRPGIR